MRAQCLRQAGAYFIEVFCVQGQAAILDLPHKRYQFVLSWDFPECGGLEVFLYPRISYSTPKLVKRL